jgi:hypothetical protein
MVAVGELVQSTTGQWMVRPPMRCPRGHVLRPGRMLVGSIACSCGRHLTWRCECGAVTYGPALSEGCSLLDRSTGDRRAELGQLRAVRLDTPPQTIGASGWP